MRRVRPTRWHLPRKLPPRTTRNHNDQTAECDATGGGGAGNEMKPWAILISTLLVGLVIGVGGTILLPSAIEPYLVSALRAPRRFVEGQVIGKQREQGHVLVKVQTDDALVLATFTKKVPEIDLLLEQGDSIILALPNTNPFVDDPVIERVTHPRSGQPSDSGRPAPRK